MKLGNLRGVEKNMEKKILNRWIIVTLSIFILSIFFRVIANVGDLSNELRIILRLESNLICGASYIFLAVVLCKQNKFKLYDTFSLRFNEGIKKYLKGFLTGIAMMSGIVLIIFLTGNAVVEDISVQPIGIAAIPILLFILTGWIVQSAGEEFLIRGIFMKFLSNKMNIFIAVGISSIVFGILHLDNNNINLVAFINLILYGVAMGLYVVKTNNLWGACGNHAAWNFFQGNVFGFQVSGIDVQVGTIVDMKAVGNTWVNGGLFGPEAGIACTVVLSIFIVVMLLSYFRNKQIQKAE